MKKIVTGIFLINVLTGCFASGALAADLRSAVVKVFVTSNSMDYYRPWQAQGSSSATGSGCVVAGNRILTNAHIVSDHTFIQVRKESNPRKYTAKVEAVGFDCDLAILSVNDPSFFEGIMPLELGGLPKLQDSVIVIGFPRGGDKLSITEGVVSRLEVVPYAQSSKSLLAVQIDAAINPGNSGGPVIMDNKLVGVAMQGITNSQNIGYMIPMPIIQHFLGDLKDGSYDGFPILGIEFSNTENKTLREYYKIPEDAGGVLVNRAMPFSAADSILQEGDVLLEIDGVPIAMDGTYEFRASERLILSHLINSKQSGDDITVKLSRAGKVFNKKMQVKPFVGLIPYPNYFAKPPYYIYGGMVFTVLSADLFRSWGKGWWEKAPLDFLFYLIGEGRHNKDCKKEVVVLLDVLPDDINVGYHSYSNEVIIKVNGHNFDSFQEFVSLLEKGNGPYTIFENEHNHKIIIPNDRIDDINTAILKRNNIPAQYSADVAKWLNK